MSSTLNVQTRSTRGKRHAKRMRAVGQIPAVIYGHGEPAESVAIATDELSSLVRHHVRVFELAGSASGTAFLRAIQYDPLGMHVLHVDLTRVSADESVEIKLTIQLKGDAPGTHHGGIVDQPLHEVELLCPIANIPEQIVLSLTHLDLDHSLTVADLELPPGATAITPADTIVATCRIPHLVEAPAAAEATGIEPEVIGADKKESEESA